MAKDGMSCGLMLCVTTDPENEDQRHNIQYFGAKIWKPFLLVWT